MIKVKICGIKSDKEVSIINQYPLDYAGFIFAKSKRQVSREEGKKLISRLDPSIQPVGVFVDEELDKIKAIAAYCGLKGIQLHGNETPEMIQLLKKEGYFVWKSIPLKNGYSIEKAKAFESYADGVLIETYDKNLKGGTGKEIPLDLAENYLASTKKKKSLLRILAGGISPENIKDKILKLQPDVVDVNSKLEVNGYKIKKTVEQLFNKLKEV